jgi:hypothetical protein
MERIKRKSLWTDNPVAMPQKLHHNWYTVHMFPNLLHLSSDIPKEVEFLSPLF